MHNPQGLTVGELINALLDIPASQHGQRVYFHMEDSGSNLPITTVGAYDAEEEVSEHNPLVLEIIED